MTTHLHAPSTLGDPRHRASVGTVSNRPNPAGETRALSTQPAEGAGSSGPARASQAGDSSVASTEPSVLDRASEQDRRLLDLIVHMSLRLRLRGVDLESTTQLVGRELDLIALLTAAGPTSVKHLVADLALPRSTMTAIVDRLQERGLVLRHPNPQDRRSVILEATPAAHQALHRYREGMFGLVEHITKTLEPGEQQEFARLVAKMADTF